MLLDILSQLDVSTTGITKLHIRSQGIVSYLLTIVPVNASLGTDPHSTILSLNYRIHTGTGEPIVRIEIRQHQHIAGQRFLSMELRTQHHAQEPQEINL